MVFLPPGSAKSTYGSLLLPSHCLGRFPGKKGIFATYDSGLSTDFGRRVRNITAMPGYQRIFPQAGLSADTKAKGEWELQNGSAYYATGVESAVTGRRGDFGIIDDPVKGRKDADSETKQKSVWQWYQDDFVTRLKPGAWQLIIQTRWNLNDLSGKILPEDWDGESGWIDCGDQGQWYVLCMPAQAREGIDDPLGRDPGDWLWPEYFDPDTFWAKTKRRAVARTWNSLYQQRPTVEEGTFFKRDNFWRFDPEEANHTRKYMSGDVAVTEETDAADPDWTSLGIHGIDQNDDGDARIWLCVDGWRGKRSFDDGEGGGWIKRYFGLVKFWKPMAEFLEVGVIRRATEGPLNRMRKQTKAWGRIEWMPHIGDKVANARALQDLSEMGMVGIANNEFGDAVLEELLKFPGGKHDDDVDMCALIARAVDEMHPRVMPTKQEKKKTDRWDRAFRREERASWRT